MSKWPKKVRHRRKVLAKIYRPCHGRGSYRVTWYAGGARQMKSFSTYAGKGGAKEFAEAQVRELARQSPSIMLTPAQASNALAAIERLNTFQQTTGRKVSLLAAVTDWCESAAKVPGRTLREVADGFLRTAANITPKNLALAVEEFITAEEPRTKAGNGQRAQLSAKYHYNRAIILRRFAATFPGQAVCDFKKELLDSFFATLDKTAKIKNRRAATSAKSRNHHRAIVRQFLEWSGRKDYLPLGHRLLEAESLRPEHANTAEVQCYTPEDFRKLLDAAEGPMRAILAIGGLAGLRSQELLRLDWADLWRVKDHIEVTAGKAKTRARRLVPICSALKAWLQPYREFTGGLLWQRESESVFVKACQELWTTAKVTRKANGLRHSFCTYHFAMHGNENQTAAQAGNSPSMIHAHYKGLATKKEAKAWFAVKPDKAAQKIIHLPQKGAAA